MTIQPTEQAYDKLEKEITALLKQLKKDIGDDYRCSDDPEDNTPGMLVTIGATPDDEGNLKWSYQTGDNSFTGGAYGHAHWGICYLYRRSKSAELAEQAVSEIADSIASNIARFL